MCSSSKSRMFGPNELDFKQPQLQVKEMLAPCNKRGCLQRDQMLSSKILCGISEGNDVFSQPDHSGGQQRHYRDIGVHPSASKQHTSPIWPDIRATWSTGTRYVRNELKILVNSAVGVIVSYVDISFAHIRRWLDAGLMCLFSSSPDQELAIQLAIFMPCPFLLPQTLHAFTMLYTYVLIITLLQKLELL